MESVPGTPRHAGRRTPPPSPRPPPHPHPPPSQADIATALTAAAAAAAALGAVADPRAAPRGEAGAALARALWR